MTVEFSAFLDMKELTAARKNKIKTLVGSEYNFVSPRYENSLFWRVRDYLSQYNLILIYKNKKLICKTNYGYDDSYYRRYFPFQMKQKVFNTISTQELENLSRFIEEEFNMNIEVV